MNSDKKSKENFDKMIQDMGSMLQVVNSSLMDPKDYDYAYYDELKSLHDYVKQTGKLSVAETQAFIDELRQYRK